MIKYLLLDGYFGEPESNKTICNKTPDFITNQSFSHFSLARCLHVQPPIAPVVHQIHSLESL